MKERERGKGGRRGGGRREGKRREGEKGGSKGP